MSDKDMQISPSCSSFEVLDPHDPVISRLATQLFKGTNDYLQGEMSAGQEHYQLLEEVNRVACSKFGDLRSAISNLHTSFKTYHEEYIAQIKPLLDSIDMLDETINAFEANAYRLDAYTRELRNQFKEADDRQSPWISTCYGPGILLSPHSLLFFITVAAWTCLSLIIRKLIKVMHISAMLLRPFITSVIGAIIIFFILYKVFFYKYSNSKKTFFPTYI